jgi:hypothetical protein
MYSNLSVGVYCQCPVKPGFVGTLYKPLHRFASNAAHLQRKKRGIANRRAPCALPPTNWLYALAGQAFLSSLAASS